ncbi:MAG: type II toxin-antitoxin system VapC family toxin [Parcubacteria group bacterium]|nr:type II toxin-antitoxin system VapC family toxin [Parcubacteria group bacterium]
MKTTNEDDNFANTYALLDTNILSQMPKENRAEKFRPVFEFLKERRISIFLTDAVYFEFTGFQQNKNDRDSLKKWVEQFPRVDTRFEDVERAALLSSCYKNTDPSLNTRQISYPDCLHASQILKYEGRAFIITADIHDYPVSIFDISKVMMIEDGKRAVVVGFITYNEKKWLKAVNNFERKT